MGVTTLETDPIDFADDGEGDLAFEVDLEFSTGTDAVKQQARAELLLFKGEIFENLDDGVDWYGSVLGQQSTRALPAARAAVRLALLRVPNLVEIIALALTFDSTTRVLTIVWEARTRFGDTVSDTVTMGS